MSRSSRSGSRALTVVAVLTLTACGGGSGGAAASASSDPVSEQLQSQLDVLPRVDGATRTAHRLDGTTLTESFTVPAGTPACLQLLARLDAGGYQVVTGANDTAVDPGTCRTATGDPGVDATTGSATILARGGSQVALTWTTTSYTMSVTS